MRAEYVLDSSSELGRRQLHYTEVLLDRATTECLRVADVPPGGRCLDLGAGAGSITRRLAERAGPDGKVVAVDVNTDHLTEQPGVEVRRHDINDGVPPGGPFDVIHARLLLMHLPRRAEILRSLADALAPGGWLVTGDFSGPSLHVLSAPSEADAELFRRVHALAHEIVGRAGVSYDWALEAGGHMAAAGLENIQSQSFSHTATGGGPGCLLSRNYVLQAEPRLLDGGIPAEDLRRYCDLLLDPEFRAWFYQFICTRGQKPAG